MRQWRWLNPNHPFRFEKDEFDGTVEWRSAPTPFGEVDARRQVENLTNTRGKATSSSRKRSGLEENVEPIRVFEDANVFIEDRQELHQIGNVDSGL